MLNLKPLAFTNHAPTLNFRRLFSNSFFVP